MAPQRAVRANPGLSWYFKSGINLRPQELRLTFRALAWFEDHQLLLLLTALCLLRLACDKARASHLQRDTSGTNYI